MDEAVILLILRGVAAVCLLAFWGAVIYYLVRDYRMMQTRHYVRGRLVLDETGIVHALAPATTLGRAPSNTIQLDDNYASSEHARVVWRFGQWWLEDRQSSNGTRLNGTRIDEPTVLSTGDVIGIGEIKLRLELD